MVLDILYDPPEREESNETKPFKWMIIDSVIIALIVFVATLPGHIPSIEDVYLALKAFVFTFFFQLALERGIKPLRRKWRVVRKRVKRVVY